MVVNQLSLDHKFKIILVIYQTLLGFIYSTINYERENIFSFIFQTIILIFLLF
jgi:hypothetical protein